MLVMLGSVVEHTEERNLTGMKHFYSTIDELGALTEVTRFDTAPSEEADFTRHKAPPLNARLKSERKHRSYTVCEVCNIQLNSAAQAQIHYNGKTHQKRLRHMKSGNTGPAAQGSPLLAALPVQTRPLQTPLELKNFLPFRLNGSSPLSLFPNFNTMDPVQKAVINHTFGVPQKKKQVISCNICHLRFNSTNQAEAHYKGHKHARKLKALESQKNKQHRRQLDSTHSSRDRDREKDRDRDRDRGRMIAADPHPALLDSCAVEASTLQCDSDSVVKLSEAQVSSVVLTPLSEVSCADVSSPPSQHSDSLQDGAGPSETATEKESLPKEALREKDPRRSKHHLHCPVCKVTVNSITQLEAHNSGIKHKLMLEGQSVLPRRRGKALSSRAACKSKRLANKGSLGVSSKSFHCEVCEIHVNSETQLNQHMNSRRHKDRLAGKPPKPKFSPHSKTQPTTAVSQSIRWNGYAGGAMSAMKKVFNQYGLTSLSSQTKLALQKQLTKSLTTSFLPTAITPPTLCTVAANPLALRHPAAFIPAPILGPTLFRPAPGPLRATHTPILFSPY
ncbi:zinc finger protein 385C isoform X3 [Tachysurus fulvidraco]|uniref:zinc finger protein 385C isoform X3 n=1 Tax=Tachysurus fulvidraco TaxID=1234273 RepID=UPI001FEECB0F|nr:zinc finger protein 385C isoform X3 [Tachysurus fulvidraco]